MNGSLSEEYCNAYPCIFVGEELPSDFELKCSVRMGILFLFVVESFGVLFGARFGWCFFLFVCFFNLASRV